MTNKLVIAKPGYNALTETDPNNLVFSSDYDTLKYHLSGEKTVNAPSNGTYVEEVTHGLGYVPFFIVYVDRFGPGSDLYSLCPGHFAGFTFPSTVNYAHASAFADNNKLYFQVITDNSIAGDFRFVYKIFRNRTGL